MEGNQSRSERRNPGTSHNHSDYTQVHHPLEKKEQNPGADPGTEQRPGGCPPPLEALKEAEGDFQQPEDLLFHLSIHNMYFYLSVFHSIIMVA